MTPTPLERALASAPDGQAAAQAREERELFCFQVGELRLAVASENVREVLRLGRLTPLPRAPAFLLGVTGQRGEVLPVLDVLRLLGRGETRRSERTRLLVGTSGPYVAGLLADGVAGLRRFPLAHLLPPPLGGAVAAEHLLGVVEELAADTPLAVLDLPKLLHAARARAVAR